MTGRLGLLIGSLLVAVSSAAGCYPQPSALAPWAPEPAPESQRVVLFGDSLSAMAQSTVMGHLHEVDRDGESWSYNAVGGTQIDHWAAPMALAGPADIVIMELGTNDVSNNTHQVMGADLLAALDSLSDVQCVVVPTLNETGGNMRGTPYSSRTTWFNDELQRLIDSGEYPNLRLVDWNSISAGRVDWLVNPVSGGDFVHYGGTVTFDGTTGNGEFANMIAHASEACV